MSAPQHRMLLLRHGETEWSKIGRHTGRTDLDLTEIGRAQAVAAREVLNNLDLHDPLVLSSPRRRAIQTAELAGLTVSGIDEDLAEWDYGDYEGLTTPQIRENDPGWLVWTHGCPGGESVAQVQARADKVIAHIAPDLAQRDVLLVGHGHFSRALMTRWVDLPLEEGTRLGMATASVAVGGHEHGQRQVAALGLTGYRHPVPSS
ncbi:acid phosphatase [Mycobacteroides saopaulense]|uniref:Acid phosphatase n=1 Tax=Mycobacteroides saopaulense TaxID=1578165 RepID=A0A1S4VXI6_9MYCO|nr:acid phosphatase [Mycobacteroides saopaulense]ALR12713.1 acid phosphatase [Mycobacteroides saopaulense]ORB60197.1 acid phosphatase [Mycobacteroides saopaulense]